ncbi:MAG: class II fructose-bisphosphate aldolase [Lachnospiraceae bacterium]|nr:class II fructose-bisphosphate aldolase [Lachnospiraceae bacterium]
MLTNLKTIIDEAYEKKYAVGSFNGYNSETFRGILKAGVETGTPIILAFGAKYLDNLSLETAAAMTRAMADGLSIPVCLHLDHCKDIDIIYRALKAGFGSVMYDGSMLPYEENLANTAKVCEVAHACGASVEAELGSIAAGEKSHEGSASDIEAYTDPELAGKFVKETGVDALAVSVGTVHGLYKGKPNIRTDILEKIDQNTQIPLVLHGGSGVPEQDILNCIERGIAKINVNTEISAYTVESTAEYLKKEQPHFSVLSLKQEEYVKEIVKKYIAFFGR